MGLLMTLLLGGVIGWIASLIMRTDGQQGIFLNVIVGIAGSFLGGLIIAPLLGIPAMTQGGGLSLGSLGVSLGGAVLLLAIRNIVSRGSVR